MPAEKIDVLKLADRANLMTLDVMALAEFARLVLEEAAKALPAPAVVNGTSGPYAQGWRAGVEDCYATICRIKP